MRVRDSRGVSMSDFKSLLAPYIEGLIEQKQALGYIYKAQIEKLVKFDTMISENFPNETTITKEMTDIWAAKRSFEKIATVRHRITPVAHLAMYMNKLGQKAYVFPTNTLGKEMKYVPHIYSDEELKRFFYCTDHNCHFSPEVPYRQLVMPLIFRTIYCCGLRPGEATNLKAKDVDLEKGTLTILASKYDTDRIVPLSKSLLSMYLEYAPIVHVDFKSNAPFFQGYHGKPITNNNLNANFRKFLFQAGISYGGRGKGPRIYDFRHTFAVNCLKNLVQRGADMNTYYPILKTYMGHSFFKYTEYYLRLTKNMYPDIGEKLNATLGSVIPEVWGDECE